MYETKLNIDCIKRLTNQINQWLRVSLNPERKIIKNNTDIPKTSGLFAIVRRDMITPVDSNVQVSRDQNNLEQTSMEFRVKVTVTLYRGTETDIYGELTKAAMTFRKPEAFWKFFGMYPELSHQRTSTIRQVSVPIDATEWEHRATMTLDFSYMATESDIEPLVPIEHINPDVVVN